MKWMTILCVVSFYIICPISVFSHTLGIYKAELSELADGSYQLSSFVPAQLAPLIKTPELPEQCNFIGSLRGERGIYEVRFLFSCQTPLTADHQILLPWNHEGVMLTVLWADQEPVTKFTEREGAAIHIDLKDYLAGSGSFLNAAKRYTFLGIEHILAGIDHLLFVLGLLLIVNGTWSLIKTITGFTIAHSITLGLATLGFVIMSPQNPSRPLLRYLSSSWPWK